jgi:hypothetical protein
VPTEKHSFREAEKQRGWLYSCAAAATAMASPAINGGWRISAMTGYISKLPVCGENTAISLYSSDVFLKWLK